MDVAGLERLLARIESGTVEVIFHDLAAPSPLAEEVISARPYALLDGTHAEHQRPRRAPRRLVAGRILDLGRAGRWRWACCPAYCGSGARCVWSAWGPIRAVNLARPLA